MLIIRSKLPLVPTVLEEWVNFNTRFKSTELMGTDWKLSIEMSFNSTFTSYQFIAYIERSVKYRLW